MAGAILGRQVLKGPHGNKVKQDQAGDQPVQQAKTGEQGSDFDDSVP
jgi:hypothetical protein